MQKSAKVALIACVVVVVGGALGFWWFVLRDTAPERASLSAIGGPSATTIAGGSAAPGGTGNPLGAASPDGTWSVAPSSDVFAGYRIQEIFAGETVKKEAAGRTPAVSGTLTVQGSTIPSARITADLSQLKSDRAQRDNMIKTRGLETERFPSATFELTEPITLPGSPQVGQSVAVKAKGNLTLHGVTKPAEMALQAEWKGDTIAVAGGTTVVLADFGMDPVTTPMVSVDDQGELEVQLVFARS